MVSRVSPWSKRHLSTISWLGGEKASNMRDLNVVTSAFFFFLTIVPQWTLGLVDTRRASIWFFNPHSAQQLTNLSHTMRSTPVTISRAESSQIYCTDLLSSVEIQTPPEVLWCDKHAKYVDFVITANLFI